MQALTLVPELVSYVVAFADEVPEDEDVKAGWVAFGIFIGLILAVAFLGYSLVRQLRKADAAEQAGLYDPSDKRPPRRPTIPVESEPQPTKPNAPETPGQ